MLSTFKQFARGTRWVHSPFLTVKLSFSQLKYWFSVNMMKKTAEILDLVILHLQMKVNITELFNHI